MRSQRAVIPALFLVTVFAAVTQPSLAIAEERVESKDTKGNGKPDEWKYYEGNTLIRIERDLKGDGQHSVKIYFENGKPIRSEVDRNGDGKPDLIRFFKDGKPDREQADLNFDGKWDSWVFYKNGVKDLMIMDKNYDGQPDALFYYDQTGMKLIGGRVDENFDGKKIRTFGSVPEKEDRKPW